MDPIMNESMNRLLQEVGELRKRCEALEREAKKRSRGLVDYGDSDDDENHLEFTQDIAQGIVKSFEELRLKDDYHSNGQKALVERVEAIEKRSEEVEANAEKLNREVDLKAAKKSFHYGVDSYFQDEIERIERELNGRMNNTDGNVAKLAVAVQKKQASLPKMRNISDEIKNEGIQNQIDTILDFQLNLDEQRRQERCIDSEFGQTGLIDLYRELSSDKLAGIDNTRRTHVKWSGTPMQIEAFRDRVARRLALRESTTKWKMVLEKDASKWKKECDRGV